MAQLKSTSVIGNLSVTNQIVGGSIIATEKFKGVLENTGTLRISPGAASSWTEGIRIAPADNGWTTLAMGSTATSGTGSGVWSMHTYQGTFYLAHNGNSSGTPLLRGLANDGFAITGALSVSGLLTATSGVKIGDKATIKYNTTDDCIDIIFA